MMTDAKKRGPGRPLQHPQGKRRLDILVDADVREALATHTKQGEISAFINTLLRQKFGLDAKESKHDAF